MSTIEWDRVGDRFYEAGVDRGVLYFPEGGGVPWNGLIGVDHEISRKVTPIYYDGAKINEFVSGGDFEGTLKAYTYPEEFLEFEGMVEEQTGLYIDSQHPKPFHLSYRTRIGNDTEGLDHGYKIHLLWNLLAIPEERSYETMSLDTEPLEFEWSLTSVPEELDKYRPTSHIVLDSRRLDPLMLIDIEDILYGTADSEPTMPTLRSLVSFIRKWNRSIVTDNGDGTWTFTTILPDVLTMVSATEFEITVDTAEYIDDDTYTISSTDKNEEDIF